MGIRGIRGISSSHSHSHSHSLTITNNGGGLRPPPQRCRRFAAAPLWNPLLVMVRLWLWLWLWLWLLLIPLIPLIPIIPIIPIIPLMPIKCIFSTKSTIINDDEVDNFQNIDYQHQQIYHDNQLLKLKHQFQ